MRIYRVNAAIIFYTSLTSIGICNIYWGAYRHLKSKTDAALSVSNSDRNEENKKEITGTDYENASNVDIDNPNNSNTKFSNRTTENGAFKTNAQLNLGIKTHIGLNNGKNQEKDAGNTPDTLEADDSSSSEPGGCNINNSQELELDKLPLTSNQCGKASELQVSAEHENPTLNANELIENKQSSQQDLNLKPTSSDTSKTISDEDLDTKITPHSNKDAVTKPGNSDPLRCGEVYHCICDDYSSDPDFKHSQKCIDYNKRKPPGSGGASISGLKITEDIDEEIIKEDIQKPKKDGSTSSVITGDIDSDASINKQTVKDLDNIKQSCVPNEVKGKKLEDLKSNQLESSLQVKASDSDISPKSTGTDDVNGADKNGEKDSQPLESLNQNERAPSVSNALDDVENGGKSGSLSANISDFDRLKLKYAEISSKLSKFDLEKYAIDKEYEKGEFLKYWYKNRHLFLEFFSRLPLNSQIDGRVYEQNGREAHDCTESTQKQLYLDYLQEDYEFFKQYHSREALYNVTLSLTTKKLKDQQVKKLVETSADSSMGPDISSSISKGKNEKNTSHVLDNSQSGATSANANKNFSENVTASIRTEASSQSNTGDSETNITNDSLGTTGDPHRGIEETSELHNNGVGEKNPITAEESKQEHQDLAGRNGLTSSLAGLTSTAATSSTLTELQLKQEGITGIFDQMIHTSEVKEYSQVSGNQTTNTFVHTIPTKQTHDLNGIAVDGSDTSQPSSVSSPSTQDEDSESSIHPHSTSAKDQLYSLEPVALDEVQSLMQIEGKREIEAQLAKNIVTATVQIKICELQWGKDIEEILSNSNFFSVFKIIEKKNVKHFGKNSDTTQKYLEIHKNCLGSLSKMSSDLFQICKMLSVIHYRLLIILKDDPNDEEIMKMAENLEVICMNCLTFSNAFSEFFEINKN